MIKDAYAGLKKKFSALPEFEKLNTEFEISTIEHEEFLLRELKKKISEKLECVIELLEKTIQPDPASVIDMYEYRCLSGEDKEQLFSIFKKLILIHRQILEANLLLDDKTDAELVKKICEEWPGIRYQLAPFIKKFGESWQKPVHKKEVQEYFG